jgi:glucose/arabinose dehydrogenase
LNWPLDITVGADGLLYVADGTYLYRVGEDGALLTIGMLFSPGYPGFVRGLIPAAPGEFVVTTSGGQVARYRPADNETSYLADGLDQLYGVALLADGTPVVVEQGTGRVLAIRDTGAETLAAGLDTPVGVVAEPGGSVLVSVAGAVLRVTTSGAETVVDDLLTPQGLVLRGDVLYIVDAGSKAVIAANLADGTRQTLAAGLPVGAPPGVSPKPLRRMPPFSGPQGPFAGITAGPDGTLYISADGEGSVYALHRT